MKRARRNAGVERYNADTYLRNMCELKLIESEQGKSTAIHEHWDVLAVTWIERVSFRAEWLFVCSGTSYVIVSRVKRRDYFIMRHQKEDTGVTFLFIYGTEIINERKIRLFFLSLSELSESSFGSFSITRTFEIYCFIFPLLNELSKVNKVMISPSSLKANVHRCFG